MPGRGLRVWGRARSVPAVPVWRGLRSLRRVCSESRRLQGVQVEKSGVRHAARTSAGKVQSLFVDSMRRLHLGMRLQPRAGVGIII